MWTKPKVDEIMAKFGSLLSAEEQMEMHCALYKHFNDCQRAAAIRPKPNPIVREAETNTTDDQNSLPNIIKFSNDSDKTTKKTNTTNNAYAICVKGFGIGG